MNQTRYNYCADVIEYRMNGKLNTNLCNLSCQKDRQPLFIKDRQPLFKLQLRYLSL